MSINQTNNQVLRNSNRTLQLQAAQMKKYIEDLSQEIYARNALLKSYSKTFTSSQTTTETVPITVPGLKNCNQQIIQVNYIQVLKVPSDGNADAFQTMICLNSPFKYKINDPNSTSEPVGLIDTSTTTLTSDTFTGTVSENDPVDGIVKLVVEGNGKIPFFTTNTVYLNMMSDTLFSLGTPDSNQSILIPMAPQTNAGGNDTEITLDVTLSPAAIYTPTV